MNGWIHEWMKKGMVRKSLGEKMIKEVGRREMSKEEEKMKRKG